MKTHWGPWTYDSDKRALLCDGSDGFAVELDECISYRETLQKVRAIADEDWSDPVAIRSFVEALNAVVPGGIGKMPAS